MEFHLFKDKSGRWRLLGHDGSVLAESACSYPDVANCRASLEQFRSIPLHVPVVED
jgi:uncharacterized protein YegP (UPF0339 family)